MRDNHQKEKLIFLLMIVLCSCWHLLCFEFLALSYIKDLNKLLQEQKQIQYYIQLLIVITQTTHNWTQQTKVKNIEEKRLVCGILIVDPRFVR